MKRCAGQHPGRTRRNTPSMGPCARDADMYVLCGSEFGGKEEVVPQCSVCAVWLYRIIRVLPYDEATAMDVMES